MSTHTSLCLLAPAPALPAARTLILIHAHTVCVRMLLKQGRPAHVYAVCPTLCPPLRPTLKRACAIALSTAGATWKEVVNAAYLDRTDLSAHGFYITPDITGFGGNRPFNYFCFVSAAGMSPARLCMCV